jgi:hypothetical protein
VRRLNTRRGEQPDDGPFTRPNHIVVSYILLLSDVLIDGIYIYIYIHTHYMLCIIVLTTGMTHLKIRQVHVSAIVGPSSRCTRLYTNCATIQV